MSAVSEVTRRLLTYFTSDAIQPGDGLPPERQLALTLGIGRSAVREALAALRFSASSPSALDPAPTCGAKLPNCSLRPCHGDC